MTKAKIIRIAENLGWDVKFGKYDDKKKYVEFETNSPYGQDVICEFTYKSLDEITDELSDRIDNYDPSEEAYLWLDESGHGKNGAPHDMGDVYKDMCDCKEMMEELYDALVA